MENFLVTVKEELIREVLVKATSAEDAEAAVILRYKAEEIVLDYSDFVDVDFSVKRV